MTILQLSGNLKQNKRMINYEKFNSEKAGLMFATDVIARGIDFPEVDWIIQVDAPQDPSFYIHRIGRTARKGLKGQVII
jgi:superfamily II DNA/RNA helicase